MRILIDIGHPAHVHLFMHFAREMTARGHQVHFTCREREFVTGLLQHEGFTFTSFGSNYASAAGKLWGLLRFTWLLLRESLRFKPDILLSHGSMYAAIAAFLLRKPHISFEDTFNFEQVRLYQPFTSAILTADYEHPLKSKKVVRYPGYHELAYLHPNRYTPDPSVLHDLFNPSTLQPFNPSINRQLPTSNFQPPTSNYVILRFVSWSASHDIGHNGMSLKNKIAAVKAFSPYAKVFISSESPLPAELEPYRFPLPPHRMHHAIAFASLVFGESATMASEAAVLGIPAIYLDNTGRLYTREQEEKYGLVFNYTENEQDQQRAIVKGLELITTPGIKEECQQKRARMLEEKIDVTAWLVDFVEEFYNKERPG